MPLTDREFAAHVRKRDRSVTGAYTPPEPPALEGSADGVANIHRERESAEQAELRYQLIHGRPSPNGVSLS
ncbi:MAG: hypothetical protein F4X35_03035 [Alphaproteobacteria bacterium]|nr:hypothetical protein [Alphaproteobacteria bacterium]